MASGRKTKLTPQLLKKLVRHLCKYPVKYSCALSGISEKTFYNWRDAALEIDGALDSGDLSESELTEHQELLLSFLQSTDEARIKLEIPFFETLSRAAKWRKDQDGKMKNGDWKAAQAMLSKLNPRDWGDIPPQFLRQMLDDLNKEDDEFGVIEAPSLPGSDDPASTFMQEAAKQQKATTELANKNKKYEE